MIKHVLLIHSTRHKYSEVPMLPDGAIYDCEVGYWRLGGMPLVKTKEFIDHSVSKKCDQETGEDLKSE